MGTDDQAPEGPPSPVVLTADGKLEGRERPAELPRVADAPIELNPIGPKKATYVEPGPYRPEPPDPRRRRALLLVVIAAATGVLLLGAGLALGLAAPSSYVRPNYLEKVLPAPTALPPLVIDSEPPGATISVNGKVLGQTPWAGENQWVGDNELVVSAPGFAPWRKKFHGRKELHFNVTLKRP